LISMDMNSLTELYISTNSGSLPDLKLELDAAAAIKSRIFEYGEMLSK